MKNTVHGKMALRKNRNTQQTGLVCHGHGSGHTQHVIYLEFKIFTILLNLEFKKVCISISLLLYIF